MKAINKSVSLLMAVILMVGIMSGCASQDNNTSYTSSEDASSVVSDNESNVSSGEEDKGGDPNAPKSLKVLSIGHSYSINAMKYLWEIAHDAGVEDIELGIIYSAGCPLDRHWENISENNAAYIYYKNVSGVWVQYPDTSIETAIADKEWDIVTLQQGPSESGVIDTFSNLENIIAYVKDRLPEAKLYWHLTWANQSDYRSALFEKNYGCDQMKMYNAIIDTYAKRIMPMDDFVGTMPCGTVIQNLRTTYLGDTLTRDGYHLSDSYGCYAAGLTWYAILCGGDIDAIKWYPKEFPELKTDAKLIRKAIKDAIDDPLVITDQAN